MLVDRFIQSFEDCPANTQYFDFGLFFKNELTSKSPTFRFIDFESDNSSFGSQIKECIIDNLYKNSKFNSEQFYSTQSIKKIYKIFKDTRYNISEDQYAQLIFLLALSKIKIEPNRFENLFLLFDSIELVLQKNRLDIFKELDTFHKEFINLSCVHDLIVNVCEEIIEMKISEINLKEIKLGYFISGIIGLNGFSGRDIIYISQSEMKSLISAADSRQFSLEDKLVILKINFFRLFIHEIAHLLLRKSSRNFNNSTPDILRESQKKIYSKSEAGLIMEMKVFNECIDWEETVKQENFNIEPCKLFLQQLIFDNKIGNFDPKTVHIVKRESYLAHCDLNVKKEATLI